MTKPTRSIDVVDCETDEVVSRVNVAGKSERMIDRVEAGMAINMNHERYFTRRSTKAAKS